MRTMILTRTSSIGKDALLVGLSSILISLMGQFAIPLPFTPVPVAFRLQTILALSVLLGSRRAFLATSLFLVQGIVGLPVFTNGASGLLGLLGPTGGYLAAYPIAAYLVGALCEKGKSLWHIGFAFFVAHLVVYAMGVGYLSTWVGLSQAVSLGAAPFVFVDILKSFLAIRLVGWIRRFS